MINYTPPIPPGVSEEVLDDIWIRLDRHKELVEFMTANVAPSDLMLLCAYVVAAVETQRPDFVRDIFDFARTKVFAHQYPDMLRVIGEVHPEVIKQAGILIITPNHNVADEEGGEPNPQPLVTLN